jgi:hypothetical protein
MKFRKNLRERLHVHAGVLVFCEMVEGVSGEVEAGSVETGSRETERFMKSRASVRLPAEPMMPEFPYALV